jgi:serine/threonine protein kinase
MQAAKMGYKFPTITPTPLSQLIPNASEEILDLMMKMLTINPNNRYTA